MREYSGSCHCQAVTFTFTGPEIDRGLNCNCSICRRKGAMMSAFTIAPDEINIVVEDDALSTYQFASKVARHHFCNRCGIYTFHETVRKPGHFRVNLGCVKGVDTNRLDNDMFDGASL